MSADVRLKISWRYKPPNCCLKTNQERIEDETIETKEIEKLTILFKNKLQERSVQYNQDLN